MLITALAHNTTTSFAMPSGEVRLEFFATSSSTAHAIIHAFNSVARVTAQQATVFEVSTGVLANAAGTDGKITVSVDGSTCYVSNRIGGSLTVRVYVEAWA
jgi:hypothetical protein